jgi:hypothetical protein
LRIRQCERRYAEAVAEIKGGGAERQAAGGGPEIELIAASTTMEALEEITRDVNREAGILLWAE